MGQKSKRQLDRNYEAKNEAAKALTIAQAPETMVVGHEFIASLQHVHPYFLNGSFCKERLFGILDGGLPHTHDWHYYCVNAGQRDLSLVFLLEEDLARLLCQDMYDHPFFEGYWKRHPVGLFFLGRDNGHMVKTFSSVKHAQNYLNTLNNFQALFEGNTVSKKTILQAIEHDREETIDLLLSEHLMFVD